MGLWRRVMSLIFRRSFNTRVVPFAPGRIYQCAYRSGRPGYIIHDPRPTVFVLGSDMQYTTGLNTHYLGSMQYTLATWIINARDSGMAINGLVVYQLLKRMYPFIPKMSFRKYFTRNLRGKLVSSGMSNMPEPHANAGIAEAWIRRINSTLHNPAVKDVATDRNMAQNIVDNTRLTSYDQTAGSPFKQRIQYPAPPPAPEEE